MLKIKLFSIVIILFTVLSLMLSCGDSSSPTNNNNKPSPKKLGSLLIAVNGLSVGIPADINCTGPNNYSKHLTTGALLDSLEIGTYTINASAVADSSGDTIQTSTPSQTILVEANKTASISVLYQIVQVQYGALSVTIDGLPNGVTGYARLLKADLTLEREITETVLISSILSGSYTFITASVSTLDDRLYVPDIDTVNVTITGGITTNIVITYEEAFGSLQVNINGLPSGEEGYIKVYKSTWNPSSGEYIELQKSELIDSLGAGDYTAEAIDVTLSNGDIYRPENYYKQVAISHQSLSIVDIEYFSKYGKIYLQASGLPYDVSAEINVATIGTYQFDNYYLIDSVEEDTYIITAWDLIGPDGQIWIPEPKSHSLEVDGGKTATAQTVQYKAKFGFLNIIAVGLPDSLNDADIIISNTNNEVWILNGTETLDSLLPDTYTVISYPVIPNGVDSLFPVPDSIQVEVRAGVSTDVQIEYKGYSFRVISDPKHPRQRLSYNDNCNGIREQLTFWSDTVSSIEGGYLFGGCTIHNHDITATGSSKFYEIVGPFTSGSISDDITVDRDQSKVTIIKTIEGLAVEPTCTESGFGNLSIHSEYNPVYNSYTSAPLTIEIDNPFEDTIIVHISGSGTATVDFSGNYTYNLFMSCNNFFEYSYSNCSYLNPALKHDTVTQLSLNATAWDDTTITRQMSLTDSVIVESTSDFISLKFYRPSGVYVRSGYFYSFNNLRYYSGMAVVSTETSIWIEKKKVQR